MNEYDDIIDLPHHVSKKHPHMSLTDRAAQFSPFKALVGLDDEVKEAQRLTDAEMELDENEKEILNEKLLIILENPDLTASITYFRADKRKQGGAYRTAYGTVKRINEYEKTVIMRDGTVIPIEKIRAIETEPL